jgi:hypothetical protein
MTQRWTVRLPYGNLDEGWSGNPLPRQLLRKIFKTGWLGLYQGMGLKVGTPDFGDLLESYSEVGGLLG